WCRLDAALAQASKGRNPDHTAPTGPLERALEEFTASLCEDLNVAGAIAALNRAAGEPLGEACPVREREALRRMDSVLSVLDRHEAIAADDGLEARVAPLLEARSEARRRRDFAESDRIRDELLAMGVEIKDGPTGTTWSRRVVSDA
ncbi:MAG: CysS/YqeB C-terminal domain-containing protein, partial [Phycisphaerales bacterium]